MENTIFKILQEWHELFKAGVITEAEFAAKKAELLESKKQDKGSEIKEYTPPNSEPGIPSAEGNTGEAQQSSFNKEKSWFQKNAWWVITSVIIIGAVGAYSYIHYSSSGAETANSDSTQINNNGQAPVINNPPDFQWRKYHFADSQICQICATTSAAGTQAMMSLRLVWPESGFSPGQKEFVENIIENNFLNLNIVSDDPHQIKNILANNFFTAYNNRLGSINLSDSGFFSSLAWWLNVAMKLIKVNDSIYSIEFDSSVYNGGAHEQYLSKYEVIDLQNSRILALNDVINIDGNEAYLQNILENHLRSQYKIPNDVALNDMSNGGILFNPHLALTQSFYITRSGIDFHYDPYQVASFAIGSIDLFVPYSELAAILKPPFSQLN